ncbi:MAG: ribosome maturation factor RimM [Rhizobacter sp.]|nr:ribosome maturation factor RimM [Rhizobacter sp.]
MLEARPAGPDPAQPAAAAVDSAWPDDAIEVGRILDAFGIKGWIKVQPYSSDPKALTLSKRWFLKPPPPGKLKRPGATAVHYPSFVDVTLSQEHGDDVVAQVKGVSDRNAAEALRGALVFCSRANFPAAGIDEYYWVDLIGLNVVDREGRPLGTVTGLLDTGPHSILRLSLPEGENPAGADSVASGDEAVSGADATDPMPPKAKAAVKKSGNKADAEERLIPFVAAHVDSVDLPSKTIVANWDFDF